MRFLKDVKLYTDHEYFRKNFRWHGDTREPSALKYHCFWKGIMSELPLISLKSLLISQSPPFEVWIWMTAEELKANRTSIDLFERVPNVRFREFSVEREVQNTSLEKYAKLLKDGTSRNPTKQSNGLRMLALSKYGGIYFDLDVLFLKDLRPLCNVEFCYQWSNRPFANNAIMHAFKGSPDIRFLLERGLKINSLRPAKLFRFAELKGRLNQWVVFPSFLFDPVWICNDLRKKQNNYCNRVDDFFKKEIPIKLADFFPEAYAYHWHNRWKCPIRPNAIVGQLSIEIIEKFQKMF